MARLIERQQPDPDAEAGFRFHVAVAGERPSRLQRDAETFIQIFQADPAVNRIAVIDEITPVAAIGAPEFGELDLARDIKAAIREKVGSELRSSIGIGPNHLLAKIAGKLVSR